MPISTYQRPGRPRKDEEPEMVGYRIEADLARNEAAITSARLRSGRFILATNVLKSD